VRNALFRRSSSRLRRFDLLASSTPNGWDAPGGRPLAYYAEHPRSAPARRRAAEAAFTRRGADVWTVRQIFDDPAGDHDWGISATVDLAASDEAGEAVVLVTGVDQVGGTWHDRPQ
jgi:hypothetical protein